MDCITMLHGGTEYKYYNCARELVQFFGYGYIRFRLKNDK